MKLKLLPQNPAYTYSCVFEPQNVTLFEESPSKIPPSVFRFDITYFKKDTMTLKLTNNLILNLYLEFPSSEKSFTDGSKTGEGVGCRLPDNSLLYTGELRTILLALRHVYHSQERSFMILSDCISSLQASSSVLVKILDYILATIIMTHSFLLKGEEPPVCIPCDDLLTIEHMLLFCSDLIDMRAARCCSYIENFIQRHTLRS